MSSQSFLETLETLVAGSPTGCVVAMPRADGKKEGSIAVETSVSPIAVGIIVLLFVLPSLYMGKEVFHSPSIDPYTKAAVLGFDAFGLVVLGLHCTRCSPWTGVLKFLLIEAVASFLGYGDEIGAALEYSRASAAGCRGPRASRAAHRARLLSSWAGGGNARGTMQSEAFPFSFWIVVEKKIPHGGPRPPEKKK